MLEAAVARNSPKGHGRSTADACVHASRLPPSPTQSTWSRVGTLQPFHEVAQNKVDFEWHLGSQARFYLPECSACWDQILAVVAATAGADKKCT